MILLILMVSNFGDRSQFAGVDWHLYEVFDANINLLLGALIGQKLQSVFAIILGQ